MKTARNSKKSWLLIEIPRSQSAVQALSRTPKSPEKDTGRHAGDGDPEHRERFTRFLRRNGVDRAIEAAGIMACMLDPAANPLLDSSPHTWSTLLESIGLASLLVAIESRMSSSLRSRVSSEDILQDTLIHVWRDREKVEWRGLCAFRTWVLTVADHRIAEAVARIETIKRGGQVRHISLDASGIQASAEAHKLERRVPDQLLQSTTPGRMAMYREEATAMGAALDALPAELREVVRLRLFLRQPLGSIAAALGIGESAVRHRLRKGAELYARLLRAQLASRATLWTTQAATHAHSLAALSEPNPSP